MSLWLSATTSAAARTQQLLECMYFCGEQWPKVFLYIHLSLGFILTTNPKIKSISRLSWGGPWCCTVSCPCANVAIRKCQWAFDGCTRRDTGSRWRSSCYQTGGAARKSQMTLLNGRLSELLRVQTGFFCCEAKSSIMELKLLVYQHHISWVTAWLMNPY